MRGAITAGNFLQMFPYSLWKGNGATALREPFSIVLTRSTAKALFGKEDAMNETVRLDNNHDLKVTGILDDLPANSTFQFKYLIPFSYYEQTDPTVKSDRTGGWYENSYQLFIQLMPGVTFEQALARIRNIPKQHDPTLNYELTLQPLKDWHLYANYQDGKAAGGFIQYVRLFSIIGLLILAIACINYVNLSTAQSEKRRREVGVRKAIGSRRSQIILQFLLESLVITMIAFIFSIIFVQLALPSFNLLTNGEIAIPYGNPIFWCIMPGLVLVTGLIAGSRPAFYLSSFRTIHILKKTIRVGKAAMLSRKILVVTQFSCSIALIISTCIVYRQLQYAKNRDAGFNLNRLMMTDLNIDLRRNYIALKNDLLQSGLVDAVTKASSPATEVYWHTALDKWPGKNAGESINIGAIGISRDYFQTLGMKLVAGNGFTGDIGTDTLGVIFNETAVRQMRLKEPLNQVVTFVGQPLRVVGIAKDALMESPYIPGVPVMFLSDAKWADAGTMIYRLSPAVGTREAVAKLEKIFAKYNPAYPFGYQFADEAYGNKFNLEVLIGKLAGIFSGLAIFISCLGLFGLAAYTAEQRTGEIALRKVLGASVLQVWGLLSANFVALVLISCLIASPVSYYFLHSWLNGYAYHISIGPGVFLLSAIIAMAITVVTISFQAMKAALANPVRGLRSE
jgi:putative ABC transport system permease protein